MKIITDIDSLPEFDSPAALTIGVYDGVHLGHQAIIKQLHKHTRKNGTRVILTFSNHPSRVLNSDRPIALITSLNHRLHLFEEFGIHITLVLPFTPAFSQQSYKNFLTTLHAKVPFNFLALGEGAAFGKNREGNEANLTALGEEMGFEVEYLKKESHHKEVISSGHIRQLIEEGKLKKIKKLLGRPYSIQTAFDPLEVVKENDTLYKWTFSCQNLCLLPSAVYAIDIEGVEKTPAIGFLNGSTTLTGETELSLSLFFERIPSASDQLNLAFIEYMHSELTPQLLTPSSLLQKLFPQPSLS